MRDDAHAEGPGAQCHFLTDAAEPGDAERLAAQLGAEKALLLPAPVFHRAIGGGNGAGEREHQRTRVLRHADAVGARRVHDEHAARARGRHVDVVHAGARPRHDLQPRRGFEQRAVYFGRAANEQRVGIEEVAGEDGGRAAGLRINRPPGLLLEQRQR